MCATVTQIDTKIIEMHETYIRLLESAHKLRGWKTAADVARGLSAGGFSTSSQTMGNWKSRGMSADGILDASRVIGCRCEYIRSGELPMADVKRADPFGPIAYRVAELVEAMPLEEQRMTLHFLQLSAEKKRLLPQSE